jgi:threonine dehydrogenase-like Zn-dependent dehydrogenase
MYSVAVLKPDRLEIVDVPKPVPGSYEARVRTEAACLCNMTDRKLIEGHFPGVEQYPLLLGHESVGIVDAVGEKVRSFKPGDRVIGGLLLNTTDARFASGWGGFSEYVLAGDHAAMVADGVADAEHGWFEVYEIMRSVPESISVEDAVMLCTWREVYGGFGDFDLQPGDDILVYGAGPVGLSFVKFARLLGLGYIGSVDLLLEKRTKALEMGADAAFAPDDPQLQGTIKERGKPFDAVIDAVGKEAIINAALPLIKMAGSVCVYGVIDTYSIRLDKGKGPYNFNLLVHQWPTRAREAAAQEPLCEWISEGKLSYKEFISAEFPVEQIEDAYQGSKSGIPIKTLLRFK